MVRTLKRRSQSGGLAFVEGRPEALALIAPQWRLDLQDAAVEAQVRERRVAFLADVRSYDPDDLLGITALYSLVGALSGSSSRETSLETAELEMLQAVVLGVAPSLRPSVPREPLSNFWREWMSQCHVAAHETPHEERAALDVMAQSHSTYYRNPYGAEFFDRMVVAITADYDSRFVRTGAIAASGVAIVAIRREIGRRFELHMRRWARTRKGSRNQLLAMARELLPDMPEHEFDTSIRSLPRHDLGVLLFNLVEDEAVTSLFLLDDAWIGERELEGLPMRDVLEALSIERLEPQDDLRALSAANPVWERPIVRTPLGYALYSPITLMSFPFHVLMALLDADGKAKTRLEMVRGCYVEEEARRLLEAAFPDAKIVVGGYWMRGNDRVESDLLVLVANRLLIFEAKGALIPARVRAGNQAATEQFLRKVWGKSTRQSAALVAALKVSAERMPVVDAKGGTLLMLDPTLIRSVSRFSLSIEQVGPLMNAPRILRELKVIDEDIEPAPCIILSELEQVLRGLPDELLRLHYLTRRTKVCERHQIFGDELDLFTLYLPYGFNALPPPDRELMILGASYTLHEYRDDQGKIRLPKDSALRHSPFFRRVIAQMKERGSAVMTDVSLLLLDMPLAQQIEVERAMGGDLFPNVLATRIGQSP